MNSKHSFILLAIVALAVTGCDFRTGPPALPTQTPSPVQVPERAGSATEIVQAVVSAKLDAMQAKDVDQYLACINDADKEFFTEQRNWFLIFQDAVTSDFSTQVLKAEQIDETTIVASLHQRYYYGPEKALRAVTFEERFVRTAYGWKDSDFNFRILETPHFVIKHPEPAAAKAVEIGEEAELAYGTVVKGLGLAPEEKVTLKLFVNQELLRQNTDIRVAYLFNGWAEDGESIKLFALRDREVFARVIGHELTHKITLGVTDSLNSWLAEGLANYFGSWPFRGGTALKLGLYTPAELAKPVDWLEDNSLIRLQDEKTIALYYAVSGTVVEFMVDTYGTDGVKSLLAELSSYPRYDRGFDYDAMEQENQARLHRAMETVFGVDRDTFNQQWLEWIGAKKN